MRMKQWGMCVLLSLVLLLVLTVGAAACESGEHGLSVFELPEIELCETETDVALMGAADFEGAVEALLAGIWRGDEFIDISAYGIPAAYETLAVLGNGIKYSPEAFAVNGISRALGNSSGVFAVLYPTYTITGTEYESAKAIYTAGVAEVVDRVDPDWSDLQKILFVHDDLAARFEYDFTYSIYDAYQFFRYGTGVCEAYAKAFIAVMQELDIPVSYVESAFLNHAWNLVQVDGEWYHLDVTHDDPTVDRLGYARHIYFLQSDAAAIAQRKSAQTGESWTMDWIYGIDGGCTDTTYDEAFWRDAVSPFAEVNGIWYAVTEDGLKTWDGTADAFGATVDSFRTAMSGLSLYCGRLYYNDYYGIRCYEPFAGRRLEVADFGARYGEGLLIEGNTLTFQCYWPENGVYKHGQGTLELSPWLQTGDGSFSYYLEKGKLYVNAPSVKVAMACYDNAGRMTGYGLMAGSLSYCAMDPGRVKLIPVTMDGTWLPSGKALSGTIR